VAATKSQLQLAFQQHEGFLEVVAVRRRAATRGHMHINQAEPSSSVFASEQYGVGISHNSEVRSFLTVRLRECENPPQIVGGNLGTRSRANTAIVTHSHSPIFTYNTITTPSYNLLPGGSCASASCYGDPERFLRALGKSEFMHVTDQYVGQHSSNRYTLGENFSLAFSVSTTPLTDLDVETIVHAVAKSSGETGYGHIYHVFIPPGQDECFDSTFTVCASNVFCAYHSSVDFTDIGHVVYSVEPFADVPGCRVRPGTPNGTLTDSTNSVLSHELIEAITDPDGDAWWNNLDVGLFGEEIGDECSFVLPPHYFFDPAIIRVQGHQYALQPEYDNSVHGCSAYQ
jgi:hypothetical protein